jgi:hypothetical protein
MSGPESSATGWKLAHNLVPAGLAQAARQGLSRRCQADPVNTVLGKWVWRQKKS